MADKTTTLGIQIDDGSVMVPITNIYGDEIGVFYFRPTDMGIVARYNKLIDQFDAIIEPLEQLSVTPEGEASDEQELAALEEATRRLNEYLNEMFGGNMADAFFGKMHPFSPVQGRFYCELAIEEVGKFIEAQFKTEIKQMEKRMSKYIKGYERGRGKRAPK